MPSYQNQRLRKNLASHLWGRVFWEFHQHFRSSGLCHAVINPRNCMIEMERVIAEARRNNQPAYIVVPGDYALAPVTPTEVRPVALKSNETSLEKAVTAVAERLRTQNPLSPFRRSRFRVSAYRRKPDRRSRRWAARCSPRRWKSASSTKAIRNLPGMYAGAFRREDAANCRRRRIGP